MLSTSPVLCTAIWIVLVWVALPLISVLASRFCAFFRPIFLWWFEAYVVFLVNLQGSAKCETNGQRV